MSDTAKRLSDLNKHLEEAERHLSYVRREIEEILGFLSLRPPLKVGETQTPIKVFIELYCPHEFPVKQEDFLRRLEEARIPHPEQEIGRMLKRGDIFESSYHQYRLVGDWRKAQP